jgi:TniQ
MTGWRPQRLPISHPTIAGEALDSWLQSYASRLRASSRDLLNHLGLTGSTLAAMVNTLTRTERDVLATATGLSPAALTGMTLHRFDGIAVTIDPASRALAHPPAWRRQTGSRFCPACLADHDGRWQLHWRLPWTFACHRHACLLIDYCPACQHRPVGHWPRNHHQSLSASQCPVLLSRPGAGSRRSRVCGHLLTETPLQALPAAGQIIAAQRHVDQLIEAAIIDRSDHVGRGGALTELHLLAFRALHALHHEPEHAPPAARRVLAEATLTITAPSPLDSYDAATVAIGTTIAAAARRHDHDGDHLLGWLVTSTGTQLTQPEPNKIMQAWKNAGPGLTARVLTALDPHLRIPQRLTYNSASPRPRPPNASPHDICRRAASLPSLLWPTWSLALIPTNRTGDNILTAARADLAAMILLCGAQLIFRQAAALLDHTHHNPNLASCLPADPGQRRTVLSALAALADHLDQHPAPINYTRRRALFTTATIDHHAYQKLARAHGWPPASPLQQRLLDDHLTDLLTGARHTGHHDRRGADPWNPFAVALPTAVRAFVHQQARHHLQQHHIHEPLTWQPPLPNQPAWPGITTDSINADQFAAAFTEHAGNRNGLRRISEATGLTNNQIRLYARITQLVMPDEQWTTLATWTDEPGNPAALARLHHHDHLPMIDIVRLSLATERTIRKTLTDAGTPTLTFHPSKKRVPAQWFADNFTGSHKTCTQAATELGISRTTFTKYAQQHRIETRPHIRKADPFATWADRQKPPPAVIAACSAKRGVDHLRHVITLLDQPSQRAAAATLGISENMMNARRSYIEKAAGITLCHPRTKPGQPITLTPEGATFLRQARTAIRRLDKRQRS